MGKPKKRSSKGTEKQYVKLDYELLHSVAWKGLSLAARAVYTQMKASRNLRDSRGKVRNRSDNAIEFGFGDSNGMSRPTFKRAVEELVERKFLFVVKGGGFPSRKGVYALTDWWKIDEDAEAKYQAMMERRAMEGEWD